MQFGSSVEFHKTRGLQSTNFSNQNLYGVVDELGAHSKNDVLLI